MQIEQEWERNELNCLSNSMIEWQKRYIVVGHHSTALAKIEAASSSGKGAIGNVLNRMPKSGQQILGLNENMS